MKAEGKKTTDVQIRYAVLDQLAKDPKVRSTGIGVGASHGMISLSGYVYKDEERIEAEKIARKVTGVLDVTNDVQVRPHTILTDSYMALKQIDSQEPSESTHGSKL